MKDFWNDVEQLSIGKNHYTGVLTLEPVNKSDFEKWVDDAWIIDSKQYQPLYIVDGQQRLTTAIILLQTIIDKINDGETLNYFTKEEIRKKYIFESKDKGISRSYIFSYEKDNPSSEFLTQKIFGEFSRNHALLEDTVYTRNLESAKKFFKEKIKDLEKIDLEEIFSKLTQNLQFNIFYIEPELDVFVTFETMNNRGKPLSHLELLKNRLIYLSTRFDAEKHEREHLRKAINESWKTIYHYLGKVASKRFTDDIFLRTHFVCYFGPRLLGSAKDDESEERYRLSKYLIKDSYKDYLLEDYFTPKRLSSTDENNRLTLDDVYGYAQHIKQTVRTYYDVASPDSSKWSDQEKIFLACFTRLANYDIFVFSIAVMSEVTEQEMRLKLLKAAERMAFLYKFRPYFFHSIDMEELAVDLISKKLSPEEVLRKCISICDNFVKSPDFLDAIRGIGKGGGYYSWSPLRYFLYEYEQQLRRVSKTNRQLLTWSDYLSESYDTDHRTIEHIYPQKALDPYWKSMFAKYSIAERNILRNSLGNLLPVSHSKNSSLSNKSFEVKKGSKLVQVGYCYGCLSEIQVSHESEWGALNILRRGIELLEFMGKRWGIEFGDLEEKVKILGLTFVASREGIDVNGLSHALPLPTQKEIEGANEPEIELIDD